MKTALATACPVVDIALDPTYAPAPFIVSTACGWRTRLEQGLPWDRQPAEGDLIPHHCPRAAP